MKVHESLTLRYPLALDIEMMIDALVEAARIEAPVGKHTHDRGIRYRSARFPRAGGTLKAILGNKANWKYKAKGLGMFASIKLKHPGAFALEMGANVGPVGTISGGMTKYVSSGRKFMAWNQGGDTVVRYQRKGYHIAQRRFSPNILRRFVARGIDYTSNSALKVRWKRGNAKGVI